MTTPSPAIRSVPEQSHRELRHHQRDRPQPDRQLERRDRIQSRARSGRTTSFAEIAALPAGTTTHTDAGLTNATQYCYRVRATNTTGESAYSNTACGTTGGSILAAPTNLAITSTTVSQINLSWTDNSSDEDGFKIERAPGTTSTFTQIATVGANVTTYSNTDLAAGSTFTYRVRAFDAGGDSAYSTRSPERPTRPRLRPLEPGSQLQHDDSNRHRVDRQLEQRGRVQNRARAGGDLDLHSDRDGPRQRHDLLEHRPRRWVDVHLSRACVQRRRRLGLLQYDRRDDRHGRAFAPSNLVLSSSTTTQIVIGWADNSNNEDGFKIERAPGTTSTFTQIATRRSQRHHVLRHRARPGIDLHVSCASVQRRWKLGLLNAIAGTTGTAAPSPPRIWCSDSRTTTRIVIAWTDNSNNETGFRIERAPGTTSAFSLLVTVSAGVTSFTNGSLSGNQTFTYRVRAFNAEGDSAPSNALTATTLVSYAGQVYPLFTASPTCAGGVSFRVNTRRWAQADRQRVRRIPGRQRRVNVAQPCDSLILKKPSRTNCLGGAVSHDGGTLWPTSGSQYETTLTWIQEGAANN